MSVKDIREEFILGSDRQLTLAQGGCTFDYVDGPNGEREHQLLRFAGAHGKLNRRFAVNPRRDPETGKPLVDPDVLVVTQPPVRPMGDLYKAARDAAAAVLAALDKPAAT